MAEQEEYDDGVCLDRISELPNHIVCHILSFLPNKYAVRTSILSPRWKYLFVSSISILDFHNCFSCLPPNKNNLDNVIDSLLNFVDRLFSNPELLSLECFRVNDNWVDSRNDYLRLNDWLCAALRLGVKRIDMYLEDEEDIYTLPSLLFTGQSLVTLELQFSCGRIELPTIISLPNLKTLHFTDFWFTGYSVVRLISSCPVLEDLAFIECEFHRITELNIHNLSLKILVLDFGDMFHWNPRDFYVTVINAPNLVYFKYADSIDGGYTSNNFKSLEIADIAVHKSYEEEAYAVSPERAAANILQAISNVNSLNLKIEQAETLIRIPREALLPFHKLVELKFSSDDCDDWQGTWVVELLHCAPNLKTLHLNLAAAKTEFKPLPDEAPSCLLFHLREIKISYFPYFYEDEHMLKMICYFLQHGTFLEKLIIPMNVEPEDKLRITKKLSNLPRKSKNCQFLI